jgi:hypothetical protein
MSVVAVHQAEDRLALRGHPQALLPEQFGELIDRLHDKPQAINNGCQLPTWAAEATLRATGSLCVFSAGLTDFGGGERLVVGPADMTVIARHGLTKA